MFQKLSLIAVLAGMAGMAQAEYRLTILHTNDFHARFEPVNKYDSTCASADNTDGKCFGGSARMISAIQDARKRAGNSILVDGGDQFQGTLFYNHYKGAMTATVMNQMGYDAMTVGNHEFDDGPGVLRAFMDRVAFPVLMSNADVSAEPNLVDVLRKSVVIERGGERLGLIGLTPQDTNELASPGPNIRFSDPVAAVQAEVDRLTAEGVTKIIVLSHSGYDVDQRVARETTGVDVIVGGHSHTYLHSDDPRAAGPYPTMVGDTAIVQAYAYGKFLGELNVVFDAAGVVTGASGQPLLMDVSVTEDAGMQAYVLDMAGPLEEVRNRVVAQATGVIGGDRNACRSGECEMGNLVADAMLERVRGQGIEVALQNGGGVRAGIDAGPVTMGEVLTVLPFQNTLSTFQVPGSVLLNALEHGVSQAEEGAGRFPQVAGVTFSFDTSQPVGQRVREVVVGGAPLEPGRMYGVVSNNYVRNGGDGYAMFVAAQDAYDFGPDVADVLAEYMIRNGPYTPYRDGRIRNVTP